MGYKQDRDAEDIKREIIAVIRELKDPRIAGRFITVSRVSVAQDLSYAKVYISALEGIAVSREAVKALTNAAGLVRREIGGRLKLKKTPELKFVADDSIEKGMDIVRKMEKLEAGDKGNEN